MSMPVLCAASEVGVEMLVMAWTVMMLMSMDGEMSSGEASK